LMMPLDVMLRMPLPPQMMLPPLLIFSPAP